jgi:hypothetical protein
MLLAGTEICLDLFFSDFRILVLILGRLSQTGMERSTFQIPSIFNTRS